MKRILLAAPWDGHSELYLRRAFQSLGHTVTQFDYRGMSQLPGYLGAANAELETLVGIHDPDFTLILKGEVFTPETLKQIHPCVLFNFDLWYNDAPWLREQARAVDYFLTPSVGIFQGGHWMVEAADPELHKPMLPDPNIATDVCFIGCYDEQTKAVTNNGLKSYSQLCVGDLVLSLNQITKAIEWKPVTQVHIFPYTGTMVHFKGKKIDLLVTPNHRMLLETPVTRVLFFEEAEVTVAKSRANLCLAEPTWVGEARESIELPLIVSLNPRARLRTIINTRIDSRDALYLMGLYIGDGCLDSGNGNWGISLLIPKGDKARNRAEETLTRIGIKYSEISRKANKGINFSSRQLFEFFSHAGKGALGKRIPRGIMNFDRLRLSHLFEGLIDSDGHRMPDGRPYYTTASPELVVDVVELGLKCGYWPNIYHRHREGVIEGRHIEGEEYCLSFTTTRKVLHDRGWNKKFHYATKEQYDGIVWCVTVQDNQNLLVMRNGRLAFCGNTVADIPGRDEWLAKIGKWCDANGKTLKIWGSFPGPLSRKWHTGQRAGGTLALEELLRGQIEGSVEDLGHNVIVSSSKIILDRQRNPEIDGVISARVFRVAAAGGFVLMRKSKGLERLFVDNQDGGWMAEVASYDDDDKCVDAIAFYLEHGESRKTIAARGRKRVLKDHTWKVRAEQILKLVKL